MSKYLQHLPKSATLGRRALPEWLSGVHRYGIPRREPATESAMQLNAALGGAKAINFPPTGGGKAAITGDFLVKGNEVNPYVLHPFLGQRRCREVGARRRKTAVALH